MSSASGLTDGEAARVADLAAARWRLAAEPELLRAGANHVFRAGDRVIRVASAESDGVRQVALARRLLAEGFPVPRPIADPVVVAGVPVTLWEYVEPDRSRPVDFVQLGEHAARLHRLAPDRLADVTPLPFCGDAAWLAIERRLRAAEALEALDGQALAALRAAWRRVADWAERARGEAQVVCHGDLHPDNVLMRGPELVIIDWDAVCLGPRTWDHAALLPWEERYGGQPGTYAEFARGYGADLRENPLAGTQAEVRVLAATLNVVLMARHDSRHAAEAHARLRYWLGDPDAPVWTAL